MVKEPLIPSPNLPKTWHNHTNATSLQTYPMPTQTSFSEVEYAFEKKLIWRDHHWHSGLTSLPQAGAGSRAAGVLSAAREAAAHKAHVGADAETGLVQTVVGTAASVNDVTQCTPCCMVRRRAPLAISATRAWTSAKKIRAKRCGGISPCGRANAGRCLRRIGVQSQTDSSGSWRVSALRSSMPGMWSRKCFVTARPAIGGCRKNTQQLHTLPGLADLEPARWWVFCA